MLNAPWEHHPFQHLGQSWVSVEVGAEVWPRFFGVDQPYLHALPQQFRQHPEKRLLDFSLQHIHVFDVGGANPQQVLGLHREVKHGSVVGGVGDIQCHFEFNNQLIENYNISKSIPYYNEPWEQDKT